MLDISNLAMKTYVRSSDLEELFQKKSFDHANLSNEETIENGETGEDDKAATTEVSEFEN